MNGPAVKKAFAFLQRELAARLFNAELGSFDGPDLLCFSVLVSVSDNQDFLAWVDVDQAA